MMLVFQDNIVPAVPKCRRLADRTRVRFPTVNSQIFPWIFKKQQLPLSFQTFQQFLELPPLSPALLGPTRSWNIMERCVYFQTEYRDPPPNKQVDRPLQRGATDWRRRGNHQLPQRWTLIFRIAPLTRSLPNGMPRCRSTDNQIKFIQT